MLEFDLSLKCFKMKFYFVLNAEAFYVLYCCRFTRVEFTLQVRIIHLIYDHYDQFLKNVQLLFICNKLINSLSCFLQFSMLKLRLTVR